MKQGEDQGEDQDIQPGADQEIRFVPDSSTSPGLPVEAALRDGRFPWYDAQTGRLRVIVPPRRPWLDAIGRRAESMARAFQNWLDRFRPSSGPAAGSTLSGERVVKGLFLVALAALLVALAKLWSRRGTLGGTRAASQSAVGRAARLADLPGGLQPGSGDLWAEALRLRALGDLGGAVVCLFAHQLVTLDRLGLIRLTSGRTGRQYVHTIADAGLVESLEATLGLFEDVYYGGKSPAVDAFEAVWRRAQVFNEHEYRAGAIR